jgi:adenosylcobinamide-phosphate guanylyltransferase
MPYRELIRDTDAFPAGVNILRGDRIGEIQDEYALLLDEPRLAMNVNTWQDLARTEAFLLAAAER